MEMTNIENKNKFVVKAQKVHGNTIDFSKVEYIDSKTKVCLIWAMIDVLATKIL